MECNHIENSDLILPLRKIFYPKYITLLREKICMKKGNKKKSILIIKTIETDWNFMKGKFFFKYNRQWLFPSAYAIFCQDINMVPQNLNVQKKPLKQSFYTDIHVLYICLAIKLFFSFNTIFLGELKGFWGTILNL